MKIHSYFFAVAPVVLFIFGCGPKDDGKIPVTTSSAEARKLYLEGRDLSERLRAKESLVYFQQAVEKDPDFASAYLALANNAQTARDFFDNLDKAAAHADKASEGEKLQITAAQAGATGEAGKQTSSFEKLVTMFPKDERAHNLLATNYSFVEQKFEKGAEEFRKAIAINPKYSAPYNLLGYTYRSLEKYDEAADAFRKYIELIPDDPNPYDSYAELLLKTGKFDASIENYRKALSVRSDFVNSYMGIACDYTFKGEYDKALTELDKMFEAARNDGERRTALFGRTLTACHGGKFDEALKEMDKQYAIAEKANDAGWMSGDLFAIGTILLEQNKADQAQAKFDQAVWINDASTLSDGVKDVTRRGYLFNCIRVAIQKNDLKTARSKTEEYAKAAAAAANNFQIMAAHQLRGMIAMTEKNFDTALSEFQQGNQQDPYNLYRTGQAYEGKGDKVKAKEMYTKAMTFNAFINLNQCLIGGKGVKA